MRNARTAPAPRSRTEGGAAKRAARRREKAAERLSYIEAASRPSNMSSSPELAKTVYDEKLFDFCIDVITKLSDGQAHGNYDIDDALLESLTS